MKDRNGSTITSKQLIFIIVGSQVGIRLMYMPRVLTAIARQDAWIAVLIASIVPIISLFLIDRLGKRLPEMGFAQMSQELFGKFLGSILIIVFIGYVIGYMSIIMRFFSEVTKLYLLPKTPLAVILLMYVFLVVYVANKGARVIGRLNDLLFYLILVTFLLLIIPAGQGDYTYLLPIGEAGLGGIARGFVTAGYYYAGIEVLLVYYSLVNKKDEIFKAGLTAIAITTAFYVSIVVICELVFGISGLQKHLFPGFILLKIVQIPIFERLEFIFLFFWLGIGARPAINMCFAASLAFTQLLKLDEKKYLIYPLILIAVSIFILALLPSDILVVFNLRTFSGYGFYLIGIIYPLLFLIMSIIHEEKVKQNA